MNSNASTAGSSILADRVQTEMLIRQRATAFAATPLALISDTHVPDSLVTNEKHPEQTQRAKTEIAESLRTTLLNKPLSIVSETEHPETYVISLPLDWGQVYAQIIAKCLGEQNIDAIVDQGRAPESHHHTVQFTVNDPAIQAHLQEFLNAKQSHAVMGKAATIS